MEMEAHQWNDCMAAKLEMEKTHKRNKMSDMQRLGRWVDTHIDGLFMGLKDILKGFTTIYKGQYNVITTKGYRLSYLLNKTSV